MKDEVLAKVTQIILAETGINIADLDANADIREQTNIDSMQYVTITVAIEAEFDIDLPITVITARTFNEFIDMVREQVIKKD